MIIVNPKIEIERPIEEVFEVATCIRCWVVWMSPLSNSQMSSNESVCIGSTLSFKLHLVGPVIHVNSVITELEPPHAFAIKSTRPFGIITRFSFSPTEFGTTFRMTVSIEEGPIIEWVEDPLSLQADIQRIFQNSVGILKILVEGDVDLWPLTPPLPN